MSTEQATLVPPSNKIIKRAANDGDYVDISLASDSLSCDNINAKKASIESIPLSSAQQSLLPSNRSSINNSDDLPISSSIHENPIESFHPRPINTKGNNNDSSDDIDYIPIHVPPSPIENYMICLPQYVYQYIFEIIARIRFTWSYVTSQIKRTPRSFYIGCSTIVIVVAFLSLLYNTIDKSGLVFLKLAEVKVGENDLIIQNSINIKIKNNPSNNSNSPNITNFTLPMIMNYTRMYENIQNDQYETNFKDKIKGLTPRWILPSIIKLKNDNSRNASILTQIINSTQEKSMQLSRSWSYKKLLNNECYLTRSVMRHLGFTNNEEIIGQILQFNIGDMLTIITTMTNQNNLDNEKEEDSLTDTDDNDEKQQNAINMAKFIYFIAYVSGVNLYPSFGTDPTIESGDKHNGSFNTFNKNCYTNNGMQYYGSESFTKSGIKCQSWFNDLPNNISHHTTKYSTNLQYNFCRNPDKGLYFSTKPWCYTISYDHNPSKETCNIPNCLQDYLECQLTSYNYNVTNSSSSEEFKYVQTCNNGIILSIQYAYLGLFQTKSDQCDDGNDIFIENAFWNETNNDDKYINCYVNMTDILYDECIGKYQCIIDNLLDFVNNDMEYFKNCPLYNDGVFELKFLTELECNLPYSWNQKIYINDTIANFTVNVLEQIPWFLLPFDIDENQQEIISAMDQIKGKTFTIDEIRWIILIATLSNFDFDLEFVVRDIITEPDGKWSEELGGTMMIEAEFLENYVQNQLAKELDTISLYLEIVNFIIENYGNSDSDTDDSYDEKDVERIVTLFIKASVAMSQQHRQHPDNFNKIRELLSKFKVNDFAQYTIINNIDRLDIYTENYNKIRQSISNFGNLLTSTLYRLDNGNYLSATVSAPILEVMKILSFLKILLNSIMTSMSVIIGVLSCIIIYCLMIIDVENGTFECGVLRSIGMMKKSVIYILNMKSLLFCLPGIIIGLIISTLSNIPVSNLISAYVTVDPQYLLSLNAIFISSIIFGLIIPIISGIIPLRKALSTTLSNSLNQYFNSVDEVFVKMINHNKFGINFITFIISIILIIISFVCLYVIPYCVATENFPLFFLIFDLIFLGLLFGLAIISITIQNKLDIFLCKLLMSFGPQKKIKFLVKKNLHSHKTRNNKTGIMLILSSAFIVFAGCMIDLQQDNFNSLFTVLNGADLVFHSMAHSHPLPEYKLRQTFEKYPNWNDIVYDYTFVTWDIAIYHHAEKFSFGPLGRSYYSSIKNKFVAVEENYCNVAYCDKYLVITDNKNKRNYPKLVNNQKIVDPIGTLYFNYRNLNTTTEHDIIFPPKDILSGHYKSYSKEKQMNHRKHKLNETYMLKINILPATALKAACGITNDIALKVNARFKNKHNGKVYYYLRYASSPIIISKLPGFLFSAHSQIAPLMTIITTLPEYNYFLQLLNKQFGIEPINNETHGYPYNLKKQKLLIKMKNNTNQLDRTEIIDLVSSMLDTDYILITDTKKTINGVSKTTYLLSIFFQLVSILTMFLCFFISFISFRQNVYDNIYQFGVLKSIGINNIEILFIFIFESIIITISSLLLGTIIGITQSILITLQSQILTENIFKFIFPYKLYLTLIILSSFIAIISSILPSIILIKTPPSHILRM